MELFGERGYDRTTVGEIAARAGLTERTFFRYFTDKREVLFSGSKDLEKNIVEGIERAPKETSPFEAVVGTLEAAAALLQDSRDFDFVRARYLLVTKHAEIQERELIKLAVLTKAVASALGRRGVREAEASLTAEAGMAVFKVGFQQWVTAKRSLDFAAHIREAARALTFVTAKEEATSARSKRVGKGATNSPMTRRDEKRPTRRRSTRTTGSV